MDMQIREFAGFTGVSVRTLHYYDEIGLLRPARVDAATGYRYYDENSLLRMQQILFYRELDFSLKQIRQILSRPDYDKATALAQQKQLLTLKKERLERLICAIDGAMKGENIMDAFDRSALDAYKAEARETWGRTDAYKEHAEKTKDYSPAVWQTAADGLNAIFAEFAACRGAGAQAHSAPAQALVEKLQRYITDHFYTCTPQILAGLGQMYVADARFRDSIDQNGAGTAAFACEAIAAYCRK